MAFNPLEERGIPIDKQLRNWSELNVAPYDKNAGRKMATPSPGLFRMLTHA